MLNKKNVVFTSVFLHNVSFYDRNDFLNLAIITEKLN